MSQEDRGGNDYLSRAATPGTPEFYRDSQLADLIAKRVEEARRESSPGMTDCDRDRQLARMIAEENERIRLESIPGTPEHEAKRRALEHQEAYLGEMREKARRRRTPGTPEYDREAKPARLRGDGVYYGPPRG
ncbi:hypothetical protein [Paludisphaera sp.]|uniref:hypothetical protein n=1 Tax=Paludisphaera sp. TaxID=2017432 RepID=UPI00301BCBC7